MQEEYVNIFHQAEQGLYETPGIGEMLTRGETWKKATPGIILGVSIVVSIVATIATCGAAVSVIAPAGSTAAAVTAGSVGFAGTMTVASGAVGVGSYLYSDYEIQKAYEKGLITEKEADSLRIYATASSSIGAIFGNIIPGLPAFTNTAFNRRLEELKKGG